MSRLLERADQATELAKLAFDAGDTVNGIAAITLAAQLVRLAKLFEQPVYYTPPLPQRSSEGTEGKEG